MLQTCPQNNIVSLFPMKEDTVFHPADILYTIGWATLAPGIDGWRIVVADDPHPTLVSVIPPGSEVPVFRITRKGKQAIVERQSHPPAGGQLAEVGRFGGLRKAVLALCPLSDDQLEQLNERMEVIYPRSLRGPRLATTRDSAQEE